MRRRVRHWAETTGRPWARVVERQMLFFPVAVTLLAMVTLLCGGSVQVWQWWCAVALVCGGTVWAQRGCPKRAVAAVVSFLLVLGAVWLFAAVQADRGQHDPVAYHLPAMRLLMEGWNPVYAATPEALAETMGVNPWEMWFWHVLTMPKSAWIYSAVAAKFTQAPMALSFLLYPFLLATAAAAVWRFFGDRRLWMKLLALWVLWAVTPTAFSTVVDHAHTFGAIGLLAGMGCVLKGDRPDWTSLVIHSFWMASSKQIGALSCVIFWALFSCVWLWQERLRFWPIVRRLTCCAAVIGALLCVVGVSPYLTMWVHYGHPFYPVKTADEVAHPAINIVQDFEHRNADAQAMGHVGLFVNAYVSPSLAKAYYRWKLGKETFVPMGWTWVQGGTVGAPMLGTTRGPLLICFVILFLLGGRVERLMGAGLVLGLFLMPTVMLGYLRYVLWVWFSALLAVHAATGVSPRVRWLGYGATLAVIVALLPSFLRAAMHMTAQIDVAYARDRILKAHPELPVYGWAPKPKEEIDWAALGLDEPRELYYDTDRFATANLRLLRRQDPRMAGTVVREHGADGPDWDHLDSFPGEIFLVPTDVGVERYSIFQAIVKDSTKVERIRQYPMMAVRVWFGRFPTLCWERLRGVLK